MLITFSSYVIRPLVTVPGYVRACLEIEVGTIIKTLFHEFFFFGSRIQWVKRNPISEALLPVRLPVPQIFQ